MTKKICVFLCAASLTLLTNQSFAQSSYSANRFLIVFEDNITEDEIDVIMEEFNCTEVWISPISQTRLWEVRYFPFEYTPTDTIISNINEESSTARSRAEVRESGLDYQADKFGGQWGSQAIDKQMDCFGTLSTQAKTSEFPVSVGIFDTGFTYPENINYPGYYFDIDQHYDYNYLTNFVGAHDGHGHGTHIASIIAHLTNASSASDGSALPDVHYFMNKTFDNGGSGYIAEIIYAFEFNVLKGMQIANFSWSFRETTDQAMLSPLRHSIEAVLAKFPILIVCAAGNDGEDIDNESNLANWPAAYTFDQILSVTTYNCRGKIAEFSNYGSTSIDITAPGTNIPGLTPAGYDFKSGTSQSTAIVSAIAAILATHQSEFDALEIKCAILESAIPTDALNDIVLTKAYVNAEGALNILGSCGAEGRSRNHTTMDSQLYPNPSFNNSIHYKFDSEIDEMCSIKIYNQLGQVILSNNKSSAKGENIWTFNLPQDNAGIYTFEIVSETHRDSKRFIRH